MTPESLEPIPRIEIRVRKLVKQNGGSIIDAIDSDGEPLRAFTHQQIIEFGWI